MKKFCLHNYIDIENDRGQEFERTMNDIMPESVLVSGYYYVDEDAISTKKANHEIIRSSIIECTKEELNEKFCTGTRI